MIPLGILGYVAVSPAFRKWAGEYLVGIRNYFFGSTTSVNSGVGQTQQREQVVAKDNQSEVAASEFADWEDVDLRS